jgi:transposase
MPKPLPESKREAIKVRLEEGVSHFAISEEMCVSIQTVKNYSSNLKSFGDVVLPSNSRQGRPPIMTRKMVEVRISKAQSMVLLFRDVNKFV